MALKRSIGLDTSSVEDNIDFRFRIVCRKPDNQLIHERRRENQTVEVEKGLKSNFIWGTRLKILENNNFEELDTSSVNTPIKEEKTFLHQPQNKKSNEKKAIFEMARLENSNNIDSLNDSKAEQKIERKGEDVWWTNDDLVLNVVEVLRFVVIYQSLKDYTSFSSLFEHQGILF